MKTTIDLPERLYRRAKVFAAERGTTMRQLVVSALERELGQGSPMVETPRWLPFVGAWGETNEDREESRRMLEVIEEAFGQVEPEDRQ